MWTVLLFALAAYANDEVWKQNMSDQVYIAASDQGFDKVTLICSHESMTVAVRLLEPFHGVFYTRGSFASGKAPCFYDAHGSREISLEFNKSDCGTTISEEDGSSSNTVIVQHDDQLIFPGDLAFRVQCEPLSGSFLAKLSIASPDPSEADTASLGEVVMSSSGTAVLTSGPARQPQREEL